MKCFYCLSLLLLATNTSAFPLSLLPPPLSESLHYTHSSHGAPGIRLKSACGATRAEGSEDPSRRKLLCKALVPAAVASLNQLMIFPPAVSLADDVNIGAGSLFDVDIVSAGGEKTAFDPRASVSSETSAKTNILKPKPAVPDKRLRTTRASSPPSPKKEAQPVDPYSETSVKEKRARANKIWGGGADNKGKRKKSQTFAEQNG